MPLCGFAGDFANVLKHLRTILNMAHTTGFQQSKGVLVNGLGSNPKIKFWHILFNVSLSKDISAGLSLNCIASLHLMKTEWTTLWLAPSPTWNLRVSTPLSQLWCTTHISSTGILPQYTMAGWHVQSDEAWEVLAKMQHTHSVNYLEAYNMHGKLLWPSHYHKYLQEVLFKCGKIVEVTLGTLDIKSGPVRCQKGLQLQLMCCTPFRLLSQDFRTRMMEYQKSEYWSKGWSCSRSRT